MEAKDPKVRRTIVLRTALVLLVLMAPVIMFMVLNGSKQVYYAVPVYGPVTIAQNGDSVYYHLQLDSLTDVQEKPFGAAELDSSLHIACLYSATCQTTDAREALASLKRTLGEFIDKGNDVRVLVLGINPGDDSPALAKLASELELPATQFVLLPYQAKTMGMIQQQYLDPVTPTTDSLACKTQVQYPLVLVDYDLRLRGAYRKGRGAEIKRLEEDVRSLRFERRYPERVLKGRSKQGLQDEIK